MKLLAKATLAITLAGLAGFSMAEVRHFQLSRFNLIEQESTVGDSNNPDQKLDIRGYLSIDDDNNKIVRQFLYCKPSQPCIRTENRYAINQYSNGNGIVYVKNQTTQAVAPITFIWNYIQLGLMDSISYQNQNNELEVGLIVTSWEQSAQAAPFTTGELQSEAQMLSQLHAQLTGTSSDPAEIPNETGTTALSGYHNSALNLHPQGRILEAKFDKDFGVLVYKIKLLDQAKQKWKILFRVDNGELRLDMPDPKNQEKYSNIPVSVITIDQAQTIALREHPGARITDSELDLEELKYGPYIYEIELIDQNNREWNMKIDGLTGNIMKNKLDD